MKRRREKESRLDDKLSWERLIMKSARSPTPSEHLRVGFATGS